MNLRKRRILNTVIFLLIVSVVLAVWNESRQHLPTTNYWTGWSLLSLMLFLAAYNLRKKLTFLPLGSSATWMQLHIYAGLLTSVLFLTHLNFSLPTGQLEWTLTILYFIVFVSGVIGLVTTRLVPKRLSDRGEEVIYQRIPMYRKLLREKAEQVALESITKTESSLLADFYAKELSPFFSRARYISWHLIESRGPLIKLLTKLDELSHYLSDEEKEYSLELRELIITKYDLDYKLALQGCLKYWLFIHIPFTYSLLIFTILHVILVYAFTGGAS